MTVGKVMQQLAGACAKTYVEVLGLRSAYEHRVRVMDG